MSGFDSQHTPADVEKNGHNHHAGSNGSVATNGNSHYASQEGGAPLNLRNITPGGHPLDRSQPAFPVYHRKFANPAPLGLCGFALTTFMLFRENPRLRLVWKLISIPDSTVSTRGVTVPNVVVGPALFYGGLAQLLAGMWEFAVGNTFGATAFSSYGAFWLSYAFIVSPWSSISSSYTNKTMFANGVAFFLFGWFIFTFIMLLGSLRSSIALTSVFFFLTITFLLLGIAELGVAHASAIHTAGGAFGIITAFNAWYVAAASLITPSTSFFVLPVGDMAKRD
ncbi:hypothetical protein JCM3765_000430 [Sporobolomyces pararoseus]